MAGDLRAADDDPWAASAGRQGPPPPPEWGQAAPPPHWNPPALDTVDGTGTPPADGTAGNDPPPANHAPAAGHAATAGHATTGHQPPDNRFPPHAHPGSADPYWSPAFDGNQRYTRLPYRRRPVYGAGYRYRSPGFSVLKSLVTPGAPFWTAWVIIAACTAGVASPVPAVIAWVRTRQTRRRSDMLGIGTRFWLVSAIAWTVITLIVVAAYGAAGASGSGSSSASPYQPPVVHNVAVGTAVTVREGGITPKYSETRQPVTVDVKAIDRSTSNVTDVTFSVCAGPVTLDPLSAVVRLVVNGPDGTQFNPEDDLNLAGAWYDPLPAHRCLQTAIPFAIPSPDIISNVTFGIDEQAVWPAS